MKAVVTGGGTGGHIYPAIAVAQALIQSDPRVDVRFIGGIEGMESHIVPENGLTFIGVTTCKLRKLVSFSTIKVLWALIRGYREASVFMRTFRPDIVISTGGYVAAATTIAAARQGIQTVIQEQNAIPGRTNRWLSRWATKICVWFEETARVFPPAKTVRTGLPIRADILSDRTVAEARKSFGMDPMAFTILIIGGSQGAQRLNEIVVGMAALLIDVESDHSEQPPTVQILHQTGEKNYEAVVTLAAENGLERNAIYHPIAYLNTEQMPLAYRAADLLICRCGVSTLAEATVNGLPMLLVPLPTAYADHQTANAFAVESAGAGIHLPQASLTPESLADCVMELKDDSPRRNKMMVSSRALGRIDAGMQVASLANQLVRRKGTSTLRG